MLAGGGGHSGLSPSLILPMVQGVQDPGLLLLGTQGDLQPLDLGLHPSSSC